MLTPATSRAFTSRAFTSRAFTSRAFTSRAFVLPALAATALLTLPGAARAQSPVPIPATLLPTTGTREIGASADISLNGDNPYAVSALYGQFLTPPVEVGLEGTVSGARHSDTQSSVGAFADYYFRSGDDPLLPYLGVFAGYADSGHGSGDGALGVQGGVKYFLNPSIAVTAEAQYRGVANSSGQGNVVIGLSTFFH